MYQKSQNMGADDKRKCTTTSIRLKNKLERGNLLFMCCIFIHYYARTKPTTTTATYAIANRMYCNLDCIWKWIDGILKSL